MQTKNSKVRSQVFSNDLQTFRQSVQPPSTKKDELLTDHKHGLQQTTLQCPTLDHLFALESKTEITEDEILELSLPPTTSG